MERLEDRSLLAVDLGITKTDNATTAIPGTSTTYLITVTNPAGADAVTGATISDVFDPAKFTAVSYTAASIGTASGFVSAGVGNINDTVNMQPGSSITYTVNALISPTATGTLSNTATVTAAGDINTANNSATDVDTLTSRADLRITKTDNRAFIQPGTSDTYTVVVTNAGPSSVTGASVADTLAASFTGATYTATSTGGATGFTASGSGNINDTAVNLPVGSTVTYTITGTIAAGTTGAVTNTATVTPPAGVLDIIPTNNSATDVTVAGAAAVTDAQVVKTDGKPVTVAGVPNTYTIVVSNTGSAAIPSAAVADTFPATFTGVTYTATAVGGATGFTASGSGNINDPAVNLPIGSSITYLVTGTISPSATGTLSNTATVTAAGDVNAANNSSNDTDTLVAAADLQITKTDNTAFVVAGSTDTYTIVVTNAGPSSVTGAAIADTFGASFTGATWTATASGGATGFTASGSGNINDSAVNLPVGSRVTYVVTGTIPAGTTGTVTNTATVTSPAGVTDVNLANNSATDASVAGPSAVVDAMITKTDGKLVALSGSSEAYTIVVSNNGSAAIPSAAVADTFPASLTGVTYTAIATGGATNFTASGSGNINDAAVNLPIGSTITYTVTGTISAGASGTLSNTATVSAAGDTNAANDSSTDTTTLITADLAVDVGATKTDLAATAIPGQTTTYTIVVTNNGPNAATNVSVVDNLPAGVTSFSWSGNGHINQPGAINDTIASLASGASVTYTVVAAISPGASGTLTNSVTVTAANDVNGANDTASDTDLLTAVLDVGVTKTDNSSAVVPGQTTTYTIVVTNTGPSTATNILVADPLPVGVTSFSWSGNGQVNQSGAINDTIASLAPGASVTYNVVASISAGATGTVTNTVNATAAGDLNAANNTATDIDTVTITPVDVGVTKTDGALTAVPGQTATYTIVVRNNGPNTATNVLVTDNLPTGVTSFTWSGNGLTGQSGPINNTIASLAPTATVTYTVVATISPSATGTLNNTVTIAAAGDINSLNDSASDIDLLVAAADLQITKTDNRAFVQAGTTDTYTIVVTNAGPSSVTGASVTDTFPASFTSPTWTATPSGGATGFTASGSGNINDTAVNLPAGSSVTYVVTGTIAAGTVGTVTNTANVTAPAGVTELNPANNSATDTSLAGLAPVIDAQITKTDGKPVVVAGAANSYTIVVSNTGSAAITGATVTDTFPAALTGATYTAIATGGATGFTASGSGNINDTTVNLPVGSTITYVVNGTVSAAATGSLTNTATVTATGDVNTANNSSTDTDTIIAATAAVDVGVTKTDSMSTAVAGQTTTYTIVVSNSGTNTATNVSVTDNLPTGVTSFTWSGNGHTGQTGPINDTIASLAPGGSVTYTVVAAISPSATGTITNTVTVSAANDINAANNTATDIDLLTSVVDVGVTKTDNASAAVPGQNTTYTIVVTNNGSLTATNVSVTDPLPVGVTSFTWSGNGLSGQSGPINDTIVSLAPGASVTYTVIAAISPTATGALTNTVAVSATGDVNPANNAATDTDTLTASPLDVGVTKTDGVATAVPGTNTTYTIVVTNNGPNTATNVSVADNLPVGVTSFSWTGNGHVAQPGAINDTITSLASGASVTYTVIAAISPSATGTLGNTVTITAAGDVNSINDTATDTDTLTPQVNVGVTKTDGVSTVVAGQTTTYTIVVSNSGPSTATNVLVTDPLPAGVTSFSWSGNGHVAQSGPINDTITTLAPGGSVTYTVVATVSPSATGTVTNTVTTTAAGDTAAGNNTASDADTVTTQVDVGVTKTDGVATAVAGTNTTYTIVVTNTGPSTATNVTVSDPLPAGVTSFSWSGNGQVAQSGAINDTITTLAPGGSVTYTVIAAISPSATGSLTNTVTTTAAGDTNSANDSASDTDTLTSQVDVGVTKTDGVASVTAGTSTTYTIVVTNSGPSTATNITVADSLPAGVTSFSWSGNGHTGQTGAINDTITTLAPGGSVTYTVIAAISPSATGTVDNTVAITAAGDTNSANDSATDTDEVSASADVAVTKSTTFTSVSPGQNLTYTIVVTNNGVSDAQDVSLTDAIPVDTTFVSFNGPAAWTLGMPAVGDTGVVTADIATLGAGASATFTLVVRVDATAADGSVISNTADVTTTTTETDDTNNSASVDVDVTQSVLQECEVFTLNQPGALGSSVLGDDADNPGSGVLIVTGTNKNDVIVIEERPANHSQIRVTMNGQLKGIYNKSSVQQIVAFGLNGNDTIIVGWNLEQNATLFGGAGTDYLFGGAGRDGIDGGPGNDHLFGGWDNDMLCGGDGNDFLYGQWNDDVLGGDAGNDFLYGESGNDQLQGGIGNDYLFGGIGNDRLFGQAGNDNLFGENGNDIEVGGDGNDRLWGGIGNDLLIGGAGNDTLYGEGHDDIVVANSTTYDNNEVALMAILQEWSSSHSYSTRVNNIRNGGGNNGAFALNSGTVLDDGTPDTLWGNGGQDWFLTGVKDKIRDKASNELVN